MPHVRGHYRRGPRFSSQWVSSHYRRSPGMNVVAGVAIAVLILFLFWLFI